jgi:hypothetical protein
MTITLWPARLAVNETPPREQGNILFSQGVGPIAKSFEPREIGGPDFSWKDLSCPPVWSPLPLINLLPAHGG